MAEAEQVRSGLRALSLTSSSRELDAATLEELRALGYIR
jgi:hypothetical protein